VFEIGNSLREARLRQGLEFPELEQATKIRGKYLRALEDEQFEVLPAQTYVRGFLRTYAEYLGLDGQLYVDEYNSRYVVDDESLRPRRASQRSRQQRRVESRVVVLALLGIAIVTAIVVAAWRYGSSNGPTILPSVGAPASKTQAPATPAVLAVRATRGSSFVTVRVGSATGRVRWRGTLARGQVQRFYSDRLWVQVARPGNVRIVVRGKTVQVRPRGTLTAIVGRDGLKRAP
jgi:cytoskeletal protein RodZ